MKIEQALQRLFQKHRIIFWYDEKKELRAEYEALALPDVEKIELKNNEYGVKYRILRAELKQKFLLYYEGPQPPDLDNWLLDVLLAHGHFRADQVSLWLTEVGLQPEFWEVVQDHQEFYKAAARRTALKAKLDQADTRDAIRMKMLAVCVNANTEPRLDAILEMLLDELAEERDDRIRLIKRAGLDEFLWSRLERRFGYVSESPGVRDFVIELFKSSYALGLEEQSPFVPPASLTSEAVVFLKRWKDSRRFHQAFKKLSAECAAILNIEDDLQNRDTRSLVEMDAFRVIDQKILFDLIQRVGNRTLSAADCTALIRRRRTTHWFAEFSHIYEAIDQAAQFISALEQADLSIQSLPDGLHKYTESWYRLDQNYRKFIYHTVTSREVSLLQ
ncbi:MAG: BREX-1 system phosphatase PglZ type A, partial [Deltaproteobacteria bacterium]|nr:BREX-1 system phosphatase PglZ type A [Deltaproteobacteria bacterium]